MILHSNEKCKTNCESPFCQENGRGQPDYDSPFRKYSGLSELIVEFIKLYCYRSINILPGLKRLENIEDSSRYFLFSLPVDFPCFQTHIVLVSAPFSTLDGAVNG
jgi:hypothetical protein